MLSSKALAERRAIDMPTCILSYSRTVAVVMANNTLKYVQLSKALTLKIKTYFRCYSYIPYNYLHFLIYFELWFCSPQSYMWTWFRRYCIFLFYLCHSQGSIIKDNHMWASFIRQISTIQKSSAKKFYYLCLHCSLLIYIKCTYARIINYIYQLNMGTFC